MRRNLIFMMLFLVWSQTLSADEDWRLAAGSYQDLEQARLLAATLTRMGHPAEIEETLVWGKTFYRVLLEMPLRNQREAKAALQMVKSPIGIKGFKFWIRQPVLAGRLLSSQEDPFEAAAVSVQPQAFPESVTKLPDPVPAATSP